MVCCLIGAFILGMVFRAARWTGRSVRSLFRGGRAPADDPVISVPVPVYEMPAYLVIPVGTDELRDERVPLPV